jgi:lysozyme
MARKLSDYASARLQQWEGERLAAYQDGGGVWTIGYGHTGADVSVGLVWTHEQALAAFDTDTAWACADVERLVTVPLTDNQFGALVSFCYNVGTAGFEKSTLLKLVNQQASIDKIQAALLLWDNITVDGKLTHSNGLANRRNQEGALFGAGQYVSSGAVSPRVPPAWFQTPKVKALTTVAAGISGTALTTAAGQAQGLQQYGHVFVWGFIVLSLAGIVVGIVQHKDTA